MLRHIVHTFLKKSTLFCIEVRERESYFFLRVFYKISSSRKIFFKNIVAGNFFQKHMQNLLQFYTTIKRRSLFHNKNYK